MSHEFGSHLPWYSPSQATPTRLERIRRAKKAVYWARHDGHWSKQIPDVSYLIAADACEEAGMVVDAEMFRGIGTDMRYCRLYGVSVSHWLDDILILQDLEAEDVLVSLATATPGTVTPTTVTLAADRDIG